MQRLLITIGLLFALIGLLWPWIAALLTHWPPLPVHASPERFGPTGYAARRLRLASSRS